MSGITGIFYRDGRLINTELIKNMNDLLSHRGPDGSAIWKDGSTALGHQMLYTTPESLHESLPFEENGLIITADARIDNRKELSKTLNIEDNQNISDSYFILKSYEKWGEQCPKHLLGDFVFVIWDNIRKEIFCARDHFGVKPFYYYLSNETFLFASEINTLKYHDEVGTDFNNLRIATYLVPLAENREFTFYESINRLPAASTLLIKSSTIKKTTYWELDINKEILMDSDEEYAQRFLQIFSEAIKCRMRSTYPTGSLLSGGLDSSSIVCTMHNILKEKNSNYDLKTFSVIFDDLTICDEQDYIDEVLLLDNLEPYFVKGDKYSPLNEIDTVLESIGEPFNVPNLYLHRELYREAKSRNVRVLLDGFDGDTTVFFEERYALDLAREMQLKKLFSELNFMAKKNNLNLFQMFSMAIVLPLIPENMQNLIQKLLILFKIDINIIESGYFDIINNDFISSTELKKHFKHNYTDIFKNAKTNKSRHHARLSSGWFQNALEIANISASKFSIEPRYPFFDLRLVEFCLALPKEQKYSQMWDRIVMRRAMDNILPQKIQWRTSKAGLGMNFRKNMLQFDENTLEDLIYKNSDLIAEYVDVKHLKETLKQYMEGNKLVEPLDLWLSVILIIWIKNN